MKNYIIGLVKRNVALHHFARAVYWRYKNIRANILGTSVFESYWQNRHLSKTGDWNDSGDWVRGYWESQKHPHRIFLVEKIASYKINSALEIGANCGPNLYLLAKNNPHARFAGIDINREAVSSGRKFLAKNGIANVDLSIGSIDSLGRIPDKSFDIVFTDAVLIYIGPDKIMKAVSESLRIARKAVIYLEWHQAAKHDSGAMGIYHFDHWKRDYVRLLRKFVPQENIRVTKIPKGLWPGRDWEEMGCLVEAKVFSGELDV